MNPSTVIGASTKVDTVLILYIYKRYRLRHKEKLERQLVDKESLQKKKRMKTFRKKTSKPTRTR